MGLRNVLALGTDDLMQGRRPSDDPVCLAPTPANSHATVLCNPCLYLPRCACSAQTLCAGVSTDVHRRTQVGATAERER